MRFTPRPHEQAVENAALDEGYTPLQARIIGSRLKNNTVFEHGSVRAVLDPSLSDLPSPELLPDMDKGCERILRAIRNNEKLIICADHDADGVGSSHVLFAGLVRHLGVPQDLIVPMTTHRLKEGYGLSRPYLERVLAKHPDTRLVVTVDQGSANEEGIAWLRQKDIDTVVTDHHALPQEGPPRSAYACITPARADSQYPDRSIAGCYVAFLLLQAITSRMLRQGMVNTEQAKGIVDLMGTVAISTTADCVDLGQSQVNRALVRIGLRQINRFTQPAWRALWGFLRKEGDHRPITTEDISFGIAPLLNAAGRVDEAMTGIRLLLARDLDSARHWAEQLNEANTERKAIQRDLLVTAQAEAKRQVAEGVSGLVIFMPNGHAGIHGVVASRLVEQFGRPTICLSPKIPYEGVLTGSARTVDGFHVKNAFDAIQQRLAPGCLLGYGGHAGAGGLQVTAQNVPHLRAAFDAAVREAMPEHVFESTALVEACAVPPVSNETIDELLAIDPYGRGFDAPLFQENVIVEQVRPVGDGTHLSMQVRLPNGESHRAIWFSARPAADVHRPPQIPERARIAFGLSKNVYRGNATPQLMVRGISVN